jgi:two-component system response regulator VicR
MDTRLLLVDDEPLLVKGLKHLLEQEGFTVVTAFNGEQGLERVRNGGLDLVVLDVMLPKMDGLTVCREIRKISNIPIIMLTAKGADVDKIIGLEIGADDYLAKPFNSRELLARIKALLRRSRTPFEKNRNVVIEEAGLSIDNAGRRAFVDEKEVELTVKEFELLSLLANNPGRVYSRDNLLQLVWGYDFMGDARTVDVHIRRLREKIERDPGSPVWILTKWGTGYYFREMV